MKRVRKKENALVSPVSLLLLLLLHVAITSYSLLLCMCALYAFKCKWLLYTKYSYLYLCECECDCKCVCLFEMEIFYYCYYLLITYCIRWKRGEETKLYHRDTLQQWKRRKIEYSSVVLCTVWLNDWLNACNCHHTHTHTHTVGERTCLKKCVTLLLLGMVFRYYIQFFLPAGKMKFNRNWNAKASKHFFKICDIFLPLHLHTKKMDSLNFSGFPSKSIEKLKDNIDLQIQIVQ